MAVPEAGPGRQLIERFADAFERDDIDSAVALLTQDAIVSMPPSPSGSDRAGRRVHLRAAHLD